LAVLDEEQSLQKKGGYSRQLLTRMLDAAAHIKKCEDQLDEQHAILAHELQSALRLTVGFSNIYCVM
jgi:hypothetical protein